MYNYSLLLRRKSFKQRSDNMCTVVLLRTKDAQHLCRQKKNTTHMGIDVFETFVLLSIWTIDGPFWYRDYHFIFSLFYKVG